MSKNKQLDLQLGPDTPQSLSARLSSRIQNAPTKEKRPRTPSAPIAFPGREVKREHRKRAGFISPKTLMKGPGVKTLGFAKRKVPTSTQGVVTESGRKKRAARDKAGRLRTGPSHSLLVEGSPGLTKEEKDIAQMSSDQIMRVGETAQMPRLLRDAGHRHFFNRVNQQLSSLPTPKDKGVRRMRRVALKAGEVMKEFGKGNIRTQTLKRKTKRAIRKEGLEPGSEVRTLFE